MYYKNLRVSSNSIMQMISKNVIQLIVQLIRGKDLTNVRLNNLSYPDASPVHNMHGSEV